MQQGQVFELKKRAVDSHDFSINGKTSPLIDPGKTTRLTVALAKPGTYPYECTVTGHAAAGMKGVFTATEPSAGCFRPTDTTGSTPGLRLPMTQGPLTDSNRRPPLYEEGPCVSLVAFVHRPVRAVAAAVGGELGSSLYRLLIRSARPMGVRSGGASP
jgi:Copper binding proteins, plastocyanin/azurin family